MKIRRQIRLAGILLGLLAPASVSHAATTSSWDGTWTGSLEHVSPVILTIANDTVVSYSIEGAPVAVRYTNATPTTLSFGDRDHFSVTLIRRTDATASVRTHGRNGFGSGVFKKL
jgi:hypothetical protein